VYRTFVYFRTFQNLLNILLALCIQDTIAAAGRWIMLILFIVTVLFALIYGYKGLLALSRWMDARDAAKPRRRMPGRF
jgi:hypothetical protein